MSDENNNVQELEKEESKGGARQSFSELYQQSIVDIKEGQIVKGKILAVTAKDVLIDIGYKSEGSVALSEFSDPEAIKIGDEVFNLHFVGQFDPLFFVGHNPSMRYSLIALALDDTKYQTCLKSISEKVRGYNQRLTVVDGLIQNQEKVQRGQEAEVGGRRQSASGNRRGGKRGAERRSGARRWGGWF